MIISRVKNSKELQESARFELELLSPSEISRLPVFLRVLLRQKSNMKKQKKVLFANPTILTFSMKLSKEERHSRS